MEENKSREDELIEEFEEEKKHLRFKYILITIILVVIAIVFSS